jgi:D-alanyl-D-alanine carboxypeptidase/D-alanyl-D-alanine-endopeptidase (penicillin-binding protein 4)
MDITKSKSRQSLTSCSSGRIKNRVGRIIVSVFCATVVLLVNQLQPPLAQAETGQPHQLTLDALIGSWLKRSDLAHSNVGLEVMELPSGRVLYSLNSSRRFVSASTAKLLTTACAFDTYGGAYRYKTRLYGLGKIVEKKLHGDLVLAPSEDPTVEQKDLHQLFASLSQKGVNEVEGGLYLNSIAGGFDRWDPAWLCEDWGQEWMPPSSNLLVDRNIAQGGLVLKGWKINNLGPDSAYNAMDQTLLTAGNSASWIECDQHSHALNFYRSPGMSFGAPLVVANPSQFNLALAQSIAQEHGIKLLNHSVPREKTPLLLAEHESNPLWTIIQITLHLSDNLYAQQLLRTLGLPKLDPDPELASLGGPTNWQAVSLENRGLARLNAWLAKIGVPPPEVILFDGCGLSRKNGISPHALNMVLKHMATPTLNGPYLALLKHSNPVGHGTFAFKTGSMDTVRSISGVLQTVGGQTCAVTVMVNGHVPSVRALSAEVNWLIALLDSIKSIRIEKAASAKDVVDKESKSAPQNGHEAGKLEGSAGTEGTNPTDGSIGEANEHSPATPAKTVIEIDRAASPAQGKHAARHHKRHH